MSARIHTRERSGTTFRYVVLDSGSRYSHYDCRAKAEQGLRAFERWFYRSLETMTTWDDPDMSDYESRDLRRLLDDVQSYVGAAREALADRAGKRRHEEKVQKVKALAERATLPGEVQAAREAIERLE